MEFEIKSRGRGENKKNWLKKAFIESTHKFKEFYRKVFCIHKEEHE